MTTRDLLYLCQFTYLDLPAYYIEKLDRGESIPLADAAEEIFRLDALGTLPCGPLSETERPVLEQLRFLPLKLTACVNRNSGSGFVAYAFESSDGGHIAVMRGSERRGLCVPNNIDWRDNFIAPFYGSVQYAEAVSFADRFPAGALILTGHSKGAHNALYALSGAANPDARAIVFNGQGFSRTQLDKRAVSRLQEHGVNYVVDDDIVGALLYHPEQRRFVRHAGSGANAHAPEAYLFDAEGTPVPGRRSARSVAIEVFSRIFVHMREKDAPEWLLAAVRFLFGGVPSRPASAILPTIDA